jgi:hypothetical protein
VSQLKDEHKVKRMNLNVDVSLHNAFKAATAAQGENMTDILLEFIEEYVRKHTPAALKADLHSSLFNANVFSRPRFA